MRQIILDIETTGMNQMGLHYAGHRIIEIGAVEMIKRRFTGNNFHIYLNPNRLVDPEAFNIHGISDEFLADKPKFADISAEFMNYIRGAELIIHNASFDVGFIDYEFRRIKKEILGIETLCKVTDSLILARKTFPGKRNSLDALCSRYKIDNTKRNLHGALLDAQILADVYLALTSGQTLMLFNAQDNFQKPQEFHVNTQDITRYSSRQLRVILASNEELINHELYLDKIQKKKGKCIWRTRKNFS